MLGHGDMSGNSQVKPASLDRQAEQAEQARPGQTARPRAAVAALRRLWPAALRRHWLAVALLTAGLVLRVLAELAYRPALFYIDTTRYLYNADGMDPVGYKGPLRAILLAGSFDAVAAVQHLLGLAMAVVLYLLLLRRGVSRWLAALAIAPVLLDSYQLQIEQTIMPDTWFEALIVAGLAILLWQPTRRESGGVAPPGTGTARGSAGAVPPRAGPSWRRAVAAGIVLGTSATVAQVGEALILPAVIYLLAAGGGWRQAIGKTAALCAAFALPIVAYCTGSYLLTGDFFLSHSGVTSFYGRMAAAADCATIRLPAAERGMCPTMPQQAKGPDWLEYGDGSPIRPYYSGLPRAEVDSLISDFNHRVLTQQPLRVVDAYARDALKPFALTRDGRQGDTIIARWQFQTKFPYYPPHASEAVVKTAVGRYGGGPPSVWRPVAAFLRSYQLDGGYTPGPLLALFTLAGLAGSAALLRRRRRADPGTRQLALACLALFTAAAAVTLVSDVFEFSSWRRPGRSGSASSSARSGPTAVPPERPHPRGGPAGPLAVRGGAAVGYARTSGGGDTRAAALNGCQRNRAPAWRSWGSRGRSRRCKRGPACPCSTGCRYRNSPCPAG